MTSVDLSRIPGLGDTTILELISEIGTDMSKWKNAKHFAAWLNLAPNSKISGGKNTFKQTNKKEKQSRPNTKTSSFNNIQ